MKQLNYDLSLVKTNVQYYKLHKEENRVYTQVRPLDSS